jgi:hypothetical protein
VLIALSYVGIGILQSAFRLGSLRFPGLPAGDILLKQQARLTEVTIRHEHLAVDPVEIGDRFHCLQRGARRGQQPGLQRNCALDDGGCIVFAAGLE